MLSSLIGIKLIVGSVKAYSAGYDLIKENMLIKCACNESNATLIICILYNSFLHKSPIKIDCKCKRVRSFREILLHPEAVKRSQTSL